MSLVKTFDFVFRNRIRWRQQPEKRKYLARNIRKELVDLGPTYIKVGQYISTRNDIFPNELVEELSKLQDSVEPFDINEVSLDVKDLVINPEPIASGSIGQVHRARYRKKKCVVKVLRPNIKEQSLDDIRNIKLFSDILKFISPTGSSDISNFVNELENMFIMEMDFFKESQNISNFRKNFGDVEWVVVPEVYYVDQNVLIMEYIKSEKITETTNYDKKSLAWTITKSQIMQVINTGYFHGDPHPGNVGISNGKLIYYDFGMVSYISDSQKGALKTLMIGITNKNEKQILSVLDYLDLIGNNKEDIEKFVKFFLDYIEDNDPEKLKNILELNSNPLKVSGSFFYLVRSFSIIEGVCKTLDPSYNTNDLIMRYIDESDIMEDMFMETLKTTFTDVTNLNYRLSSIEKSVENSQSNLTLTFFFIILISDWIVGFLL